MPHCKRPAPAVRAAEPKRYYPPLPYLSRNAPAAPEHFSGKTLWQGALILLTMVVLTTFLKFDLLFRPVTLLLGNVELNGRLFVGNSIVYVLLDYFIAFAEIAVIQSIAIGCRWLVTRKLRKGKTAPEAMD